jgi:hypothetical protein
MPLPPEQFPQNSLFKIHLCELKISKIACTYNNLSLYFAGMSRRQSSGSRMISRNTNKRPWQQQWQQHAQGRSNGELKSPRYQWKQ